MPYRGDSYAGSSAAGDGSTEPSSQNVAVSHTRTRIEERRRALRKHQAAHEARIATLNEQSKRYCQALEEEIFLLEEAETLRERLEGGQGLHGEDQTPPEMTG